MASPVPPEFPELPERALTDGSALPLSFVLTAPTVALTSPVRPVPPELPERAAPSETAVELAEPVLPVLVEEDWAMAAPESPEIAAGDWSALMLPPSPPLASTLAMLSPPGTFGPPLFERARASPARLERTRSLSPPLAPLPPMSVPRTTLATSPVVPDVESAEEMAPELARLLESPLIRALPVLPESPERPDSTDPLTFAVPLMPVLMAPAVNLASPVSPETDLALDSAPELAPLSAVPEARAAPVLPESPERPDLTAPRSTAALPLILVLRAPAVALTSPVAPVLPESPLLATGLAQAVELAPPVLPVFVEEDWAVEAPESPEMATGSCVIFTLPPSPPLTSALAIESPPVTLPWKTRERFPTRVRLLTSPARLETARALSPPRPPLPPMPVARTRLAASPVVPDTELACDSAPELASDLAEPLAVASPVLPESPLRPEVMAPVICDLPLMALFRAPRLALALPLLPVSPGLPLSAIGLPTAAELAPPVLPVLVDEDWACDAPESPEIAEGV